MARQVRLPCPGRRLVVWLSRWGASDGAAVPPRKALDSARGSVWSVHQLLGDAFKPESSIAARQVAQHFCTKGLRHFEGCLGDIFPIFPICLKSASLPRRYF